MRSLALVSTLFLLAACGGAPPKPNKAVHPVDYRATIADPVGFLPIDTDIVIGLDAEQLRRSRVWPMLEPRLLAEAGQDLADFKTACGVDPMATIRGITFSLKQSRKPTPNIVVVVTGLDREQVMACLRNVAKTDPSLKIAADGTVITDVPDNDVAPVAFAFVDAVTAVVMIGPDTSSSAFAKVLASGSPLRSSPEFGARIARINLKAALWTMLDGKSKFFAEAAAKGLYPKALVGSINLAAGMDASVHLQLSSPEEAQHVHTVAQDQLGMVSGFVDKLDITVDGSDVALTAVMTDAQLQNVLSLVNGMLGSP